MAGVTDLPGSMRVELGSVGKSRCSVSRILDWVRGAVQLGTRQRRGMMMDNIVSAEVSAFYEDFERERYVLVSALPFAYMPEDVRGYCKDLQRKATDIDLLHATGRLTGEDVEAWLAEWEDVKSMLTGG